VKPTVGHNSNASLGVTPGAATEMSQGGSFLYVATVIQPLSSPQDIHGQGGSGSGDAEEDEPQLNKYMRTILILAGMVLPVFLSWIVGDEH
jgi:zinc transporter 9